MKKFLSTETSVIPYQLTFNNASVIVSTVTEILCFVGRVSRKMRVTKPNLMHYLSSLDRDITPIHISGLLVAQHKEEAMWTRKRDHWYVMYVLVDSLADPLAVN
jgi:hypothetical protein